MRRFSSVPKSRGESDGSRRSPRPTMMACLLAGACLVIAAAASQAEVQPPLRLGVANDATGPYAAIGGSGSVLAARIAAEESGGAVRGRRIEILWADTQNKPDLAAALVREWFDKQNVGAVIDGGASSVGLAIQALAQERGKIYLNSGATSSEFVGRSCTPTTLQFVANTRALAVAGLSQALQEGVDTWFFVTADYTFGHSLEADATGIINASGGRVLGAVRHPLGTTDMSSYLLQAKASGAKGLAFANAGADFVNSLKQAHEFGLDAGQFRIVGLLVNISDLEALGSEHAQGLQFATAFFPTMNPDALDWSRRFSARHGGHPPTMIQAMSYSATGHYLKAVEAAGTDEAGLAAWLHEHSVNDHVLHDAAVRADGRVMNDVYVVQVKEPAAITDPLDNLRLIGTLRADQVYPGPGQSTCRLLRQAPF